MQFRSLPFLNNFWFSRQGFVFLCSAALCSLPLSNANAATHVNVSGRFGPATVGSHYSVTLGASGGTAPYNFTLSWGQLPAGLTLGETAGVVSGTPSVVGTSNFGIYVADLKGHGGSQRFQITVSSEISVTVSPSTATVVSAGWVSFAAAVDNSSNQSVSWSATSGTISSSGLYQAPSVKSNFSAIVTASSNADPTKSASATVTITAPPITLSGSFVAAQVGISYSVTLSVGGGTTPFTFSISSGQLPPGLNLGISNGIVSGMPATPGTYSFVVTATDVNRVSGSQTFQIIVSPAIRVTVTPAAATIASGGTVPFAALVTNTANTTVNWSATTGTVSTAGLYQATDVATTSTATVTATSAADSTKSAAALVTITPVSPPPVVISTTSLSGATAGTSYLNVLNATGGKTPYSWSLADGTLPKGIAVQPSGWLSGTPTQTGTFNFTIEAADSSSPQQTATQALALAVSSNLNSQGNDAALFGFTENNTSASNFPSVSFAMQRFWDSPPLQWPSINTASGVFTFASLDSALATAYTKGVTQALYTLARTPPWASSAPSDMNCNYATAHSGGGGGECDAPNDLNSDGSGSNAIWKAWVTAIASHVNDAGYLQTHAHIGYWEIWNEPDTQAFWGGSIAQLARLTEDANCIITGRGVIHQSGDGSATPCNASPIDPKAKIVMAAAHGKGVSITYGQNELYCSAAPTGYRLPCPNPPNAIATAVDIINFHLKPGNETGNKCPAPIPCTPESAMQWYVSNIKAILQPAELAKPLWNGEASYSKSGFTGAYTDVDMEASFMPRYWLINWSLGISAMYWYTWESMSPTAAQPAYQQTYNWLYGATLSTPCAAVGTVWSCGITKSGAEYLIMWDAAQSCANGSCTTGNQTVAAKWTQYQDMTTASTPIGISGGVVPVGIKPIVMH